jgi:hypothetical protein
MLLMTMALALMLVAPAAGQGSTPAPAAESPVGVLGEVQVEALPSPDAEVWFIRFFLEPGGSLPLDMQIGPTVAVVESGAMTFTSDAPLEVSGGMAATPVAIGAGMQDTVVTAGQTVYVHEDTTIAVRNDGDETASMLALLTFSPQRETEAMEAAEASGTPMEPIGFSQEPLGVTRAAFPEGPGTITIERVALQPGETARMDVPAGAAVGGVEQGGATLTPDAGTCYLWPGIMEPVGPEGGAQGPERTDLGAGDTGELAAGDAFGCWDAGIDWQAGEEGATIIQARVTPVEAEATPAS